MASSAGVGAPQANNKAKFFGSRRRSLAHMRLKPQNSDGGGDLTDLELCVLASIDAKGRLSTPSAVDTFLQAMMHASTVSDRTALNERCSNAKWQSKALVPLITVAPTLPCCAARALHCRRCGS
eukprot:12515-Heterococcus_DN1.PRE.1